MLTKSRKSWQLLSLSCFNIHVGLKCKEKNASRYFRNEYKKIDWFLDIFKKLSNKKESYKSNDKVIFGRFERISDYEQETKDGSIQIELPSASVSKDGTTDCRKQSTHVPER